MNPDSDVFVYDHLLCSGFFRAGERSGKVLVIKRLGYLLIRIRQSVCCYVHCSYNVVVDASTRKNCAKGHENLTINVCYKSLKCYFGA